ncbi:polyprenyl synthetase family protein [Mycolicibacterium sp.]|uniref:polyprenyl synthetase family protein n=1 Tax=Mycolicibacterium sp. TaxID=2320850 RepID=UPI003D0EE024
MSRGQRAGAQLAEPGVRVWRHTVQQHLADFVRGECVRRLDDGGVDIAGELLCGYLDGGKYVRSTYMYLGWLCGADEDTAALRASASLELLHTFALLQDDVMDRSPMRRSRPSAHVAFGRWHRERGLSGSANRFGESAAILLGDLCLVWAEEMLRRSGMSAAALARVWPRYDAMRTELAIGQLSDLLNSCQSFPTLPEVLDVLRRKSGNYTVRRPLEIGAAMAGCSTEVADALSGYGTAIGEAFQLRDDILGVFGSPSLTGKPARSDMEEGKATSVIVAAYELAEPAQRRQLAELMRSPDLGPGDVERWRALITASGAVQWIEELIAARHDAALSFLDGVTIPELPRAALAEMAVACTQRAA